MTKQKQTGSGGGKRLPKKQRAPEDRLRLGVLITGAALVLVLLLVLAVNSLFVKPELPSGDPPAAGTDSQGDAASDSGAQAPAGSQPQEDPYGGGIRPQTEGERKSEEFYTVLILGRDTGGGGNTDTILLASYDVTNQRAAVMSIPRDTMVNVPWDVKKLNSVYSWYGGGERGIERVYGEISQLVGFEPDFQIVVEWEAVGEIVDAIGGVWFDVPYYMDYDDPAQDLHIHQEKGYRFLSGSDAMEVVRWRMNNPGSPYGAASIGDAGRMELQQSFLKALAAQVLSIENLANMEAIAAAIAGNVTTDLTFQNLLWFGKQAVLGGLTIEDITFTTMPYAGASAWSRTYRTDLSYVVPRGDELLELVNQSFSPYAEEFELSDLDIMSVNADGSVSSSTGVVQDTEATYPRPY